MKVNAKADRRGAEDREADRLWNKMVSEARLSPFQAITVKHYLRALMRKNILDVQSIVEMGWMLALIETQGFGCGERSTRLQTCQKYAMGLVNEALSHECINGNQYASYDGCAVERMRNRMQRHGCDYFMNVRYEDEG